MRLLFNILLYEVVWFLCVFWGDRGALLALVLIGVHLIISPCRKADLIMMAVLLGFGLVIDGLIHAAGYISYHAPARPIPLWLVVIWLGLALMVHHCLRWMKQRLLLSALFGAIGGPMAYWAGVKAGAAEFEVPLMQVLLLLSLIWALLWPAVMYIGQRILPKAEGGRDFAERPA